MEIKHLLEVPVSDFDLILLDLDNTLYNYHSNHQFALGKLIARFQQLFNITADDVKALYMDSRKKIHDRHHGTAVSHSRLFYIQDMVEKVAITTNTNLVTELYNIYWDSFISQMQLFDEAITFLDKCIAANVPVIMVTDMTSEVQFKKIEKLQIGKYFSFIVTSEEAGIEKPHPFIFELAINKALRIKRNLKTIAVVGDDVKKDLHVSDIYPISIFHLLKHE